MNKTPNKSLTDELATVSAYGCSVLHVHVDVTDSQRYITGKENAVGGQV